MCSSDLPAFAVGQVTGRLGYRALARRFGVRARTVWILALSAAATAARAVIPGPTGLLIAVAFLAGTVTRDRRGTHGAHSTNWIDKRQNRRMSMWSCSSGWSRLPGRPTADASRGFVPDTEGRHAA